MSFIRVASSVLLSLAANGLALTLLLAGYWFLGSTLRTEDTIGGGAVTRSLTTPALIVFEIVFYAAISLFLASLVFTTIRVSGILKADPRTTIVLLLFVVGLLAYPFIGLSSLMSACALGEGFPLGTQCD